VQYPATGGAWELSVSNRDGMSNVAITEVARWLSHRKVGRLLQRTVGYRGSGTKINNRHCPAKKILRCVNAKLPPTANDADGQSSDLERRVGRRVLCHDLHAGEWPSLSSSGLTYLTERFLV
jgi:hypothetical protein